MQDDLAEMEAAERAKSSGATNGARTDADTTVDAPETDANHAAGALTVWPAVSLLTNLHLASNVFTTCFYVIDRKTCC